MQEGSLVQVDGSVSRSHPFRLTGLVRHQMLGPRSGSMEVLIDVWLGSAELLFKMYSSFVSTNIPKVKVENCFVWEKYAIAATRYELDTQTCEQSLISPLAPRIQPLANLTAVRSWPEGCRKLLAVACWWRMAFVALTWDWRVGVMTFFAFGMMFWETSLTFAHLWVPKDRQGKVLINFTTRRHSEFSHDMPPTFEEAECNRCDLRRTSMTSHFGRKPTQPNPTATRVLGGFSLHHWRAHGGNGATPALWRGAPRGWVEVAWRCWRFTKMFWDGMKESI